MKNLIISTITLLCLLTTTVLTATTYTWNASNGFWHEPSNWSPAGIPGISDQVIIANGTCYLLDTISVTDLIISGGELNTDSTMNVLDEFVWQGGKVVGWGNLFVAGTTSISNAPQLWTKTLVMNGGGFTATDGVIQTYQFASIVIPAGQTFTVNTNHPSSQWGGDADGGSVVVEGTLNKNGSGWAIFWLAGVYHIGHH